MDNSDKNLSLVESVEAKKQARKQYYYAHKAKIQTQKKNAKTSLTAEICKQKNIPIALAPYLRFHAATKDKKHMVSLKFESTAKMLSFLQDWKFKNDITELEIDKLVTFFAEEEKDMAETKQKEIRKEELSKQLNLFK